MAHAAARGLSRPEPEVVDRAIVESLLPAGAVHQGLALDCAPLPVPTLDQLLNQLPESACILVLDQVTDPHNVGAILRSAAAFGVAAAMVPNHHAPNVTGALAKSAAGAVEHVPMLRVPNLAQGLERLKTAGFWVTGLTEHSDHSLAAAVNAIRQAIILGAEGKGLRRLTADQCDLLVSLPTSGPLVSLNVSNAAAVALYERARCRPPQQEEVAVTQPS